LASKRERNRYEELLLLQRCGDISDLKTQVKYVLIPKQEGERACEYRADFVYLSEGRIVVEDTKGFRTKDYVIKRKLMLFRHGLRIQEV
jgi:hypothetical protein